MIDWLLLTYTHNLLEPNHRYPIVTDLQSQLYLSKTSHVALCTFVQFFAFGRCWFACCDQAIVGWLFFIPFPYLEFLSKKYYSQF